MVVKFNSIELQSRTLMKTRAFQLATTVDDINMQPEEFRFICPTSCQKGIAGDCTYEQFVKHTEGHREELFKL